MAILSPAKERKTVVNTSSQMDIKLLFVIKVAFNGISCDGMQLLDIKRKINNPINLFYTNTCEFMVQWLSNIILFSPVGWGCRIHRLHLCIGRGKTSPLPNECLGACRIPLYCHSSLVHWLVVEAPERGPIYGSNRTVWHLNNVQTNDRLNIIIWFGLVWWHINNLRLFNTRSILYI